MRNLQVCQLTACRIRGASGAGVCQARYNRARVPCEESLAERFRMAGGRRRLRYPVRVSGPNGPVTVRFMTPSRPGWSLEEPVHLVRHVYTMEHPSRVSGWAYGLIEARVRKLPQATKE